VNTKTAPPSANLPTLTREMIAMWEAELNEFVSEIQSRLETIAVSLSKTQEPPSLDIPHPLAPESGGHLSASSTERKPTWFSEFEQQRVSDREAGPSLNEALPQPSTTDETCDRLLAIKQRIASRLQGEPTS